MMTPEHFVEAISIPMLPRVHNPWGQICPLEISVQGAEDRKARLQAHLSSPAPALIIVGDAAGHKGTRYTGIPFTTEKLLSEGFIPRVRLPRRSGRIMKRDVVTQDRTAEAVWRTLHDNGMAENTILCNAMPWHPEGERGSTSDRRPTDREINLGRVYLQVMLDMYPNVPVAAVGAIAEKSLRDLSVTFYSLKDPDSFGDIEFNNSINQLIRKMKSLEDLKMESIEPLISSA